MESKDCLTDTVTLIDGCCQKEGFNEATKWDGCVGSGLQAEFMDL
ncbi:hypothetical protein NC651_038358 [Populus alba x Populus x berolinensis]|nr:hypothetical protein NC651_038358 [Populus alba x Populus x berolinensis]